MNFSFTDILDKLDLTIGDLYDLGLYIEETEINYLDSDEEDLNREITINREKNKKKKKKLTSTQIQSLVESGVSYEEPPHDYLLPTPFSLLINGKPGSGKSTVLMNILDWYDGYFDNIFIWSPTIAIDISWKEFLNKHKDTVKKENVFKAYYDKDIKEIMKQIKKANKGKKNYPDKVKTLFIFDDIITELPRRQLGDFNKLLFNHRHYGISHITISQEYKSFPPKMRKSAFGMIIYDTDNGLEFSGIVDELSKKVGKQLFTSMFEECVKDKYGFFYIKNKESDLDKKYFKNFDKCLEVSKLKSIMEGNYDTDEEDYEEEEEDE